jgi:hypothetical protein
METAALVMGAKAHVGPNLYVTPYWATAEFSDWLLGKIEVPKGGKLSGCK